MLTDIVAEARSRTTNPRNSPTFQETYDLCERIGQGAFSKVHRCTHIKERRDYAAKIINTEKLNARQRDKLDREARICRMLSHPSIVRLHFTSHEEKKYYMVFDLIQGGELFDDIVARESYSEMDASRCIQQVLDAICYCHKRNIVHRDLKPENLLLESKKNKDVKLADFGLALEVNDQRKQWFGFAGTPGYMSPEVIRKEPYGKAVDIWACGVILYILLVGYPPFWSDNQEIMFGQIKRGEYDFPSPEWDDVGPEVRRLIGEMLNPDQETRLTAEAALNNPWVSQREGFVNNFHRQATVEAMKKFNARRKMKSAIITTLFTTRTASTINRLRSQQANTASSANSSVAGAEKAKPTGGTIVGDEDESEEAKKTFIIQLTQATINAAETGNYEDYSQFCDPQMTCVEPETFGNVVEGLDFHRFYFDNHSSKNRAVKGLMVKPHVTLLGTESAVICYTRLSQAYHSDTRTFLTTETAETRVWHKKDGKWQLVHFHRSATGSSM